MNDPRTPITVEFAPAKRIACSCAENMLESANSASNVSLAQTPDDLVDMLGETIRELSDMQEYLINLRHVIKHGLCRTDDMVYEDFVEADDSMPWHCVAASSFALLGSGSRKVERYAGPAFHFFIRRTDENPDGFNKLWTLGIADWTWKCETILRTNYSTVESAKRAAANTEAQNELRKLMGEAMMKNQDIVIKTANDVLKLLSIEEAHEWCRD